MLNAFSEIAFGGLAVEEIRTVVIQVQTHDEVWSVSCVFQISFPGRDPIKRKV